MVHSPAVVDLIRKVVAKFDVAWKNNFIQRVIGAAFDERKVCCISQPLSQSSLHLPLSPLYVELLVKSTVS